MCRNHRQWVFNHVCFLYQSDREKSEGLPVAPFMDRDKVTKPTAQIGFIKFVLIPMFETVMKVWRIRGSDVVHFLEVGGCFVVTHTQLLPLSLSSSFLRLRKLWCNLYGIPVTIMKNWNRLTTPWLRWQLFFPDLSADLRDRLLCIWVCLRDGVASSFTISEFSPQAQKKKTDSMPLGGKKK